MKKYPAVSFAALILLLFVGNTFAQTGKEMYETIRSFQLSGGKADVNALTVKRDRVEMSFTGTFYFSAGVDGKAVGAVFTGRGTFRATAPENDFERSNLKRLTGADDVLESDFTSAVIRSSDDLVTLLGATSTPGAAAANMQELATNSGSRVLKETGANLAARVASAILNVEREGFFFANFDGGKRGNFNFIFDPQTRLPTDYFGINAGEKGLIYKYESSLRSTDVWLAFYSQADYQTGVVSYSDSNDVVDIADYQMDIDLTDPKKRLALKAKMKMESRFEGTRIASFSVGENLSEVDDTRLKKQMRVRSVKFGGQEIPFAQEDWEGGFSIFFPAALIAKQAIELDMELDGDFMQQPNSNISYPISNSSWYPRHGYLDRSTFTLSYLHSKKNKVASVGNRRSEAPTEGDNAKTVYQMDHPVALVTFALGTFKRHAEMIKWDKGGKPTPLEFNSLDFLQIEEDLIMAEMNNSVRYFHQLFGDYPYENYSATFHPYPFGQGFPSMLMIPATNYANKNTYSFIAHETAHQWWGNIVAWRSYRDQWLSEGFAEYSGVVYTNLRKDNSAGRDLISDLRESLKQPPPTLTGPGKGRIADIGPLILGHRLSSKKTLGGYQTLVYNKGTLVLRMMHFLFTDPVSGDGEPFYKMMRDFVSRHRNRTASTDDFRIVANEHFARTPIAARYQMKNLDWFFQQWVYQAHLPSYQLEYELKPRPDGSCIVAGNVVQENAGKDWVMPIPVVFKFGGDRIAQGTVLAFGAKQSFQIKLPSKPEGVELDPRRWVLSDKSSTKKL